MLLNRRDWVYSLSLLMPSVVYNLSLKAYDVVSSRRGPLRFTRTLELLHSDVFFNLGYVLLWIGLFATAQRGPLRWVVVFLFHITTALVAVIRTGAHRYFRETGTTLDYDILALWAPRFDEVKPMIKLPPFSRMLLSAASFYVFLGPLLVTRVIGRRRGWQERCSAAPAGISSSGFLRLCLQALGFFFLSLLVGSKPTVPGRSFARDPLVNLIVTGLKEARTRQDEPNIVGQGVEHPAASVRLVGTPRTEKRNVILIHLESARARSMTPYNEDLKTTPFLYELAKSSLLTERAYTTIPNTLKASISVNCGVEPDLRPGAEAQGGVSVRGLADLLKEQGYRTVFFQSSTQNFENFGNLANRLGYEDYYPLESMDTEGFERTNYFGYEDDIMLKPSRWWLEEHRDKPFVAKYLTGTGHHDYLPPTRYGLERFSEDDRLNRYLNCLRYQDFFVKNLIEQYKELGLYDGTIFVIYGDHGEGFGEHGRYVHENNPYEESLRVPLLIHCKERFRKGERFAGLANHLDILPTVLDLLGYEVEGWEYPGHSLLRPPGERTLVVSCFNKDKCLVSIRSREKYIHHYGDRPDELFDLEKDPLEEHNLAGERARKETDERREELLKWRSKIETMYGRRTTR
jgi:arylsulfatase A-like enzyme